MRIFKLWALAILTAALLIAILAPVARSCELTYQIAAQKTANKTKTSVYVYFFKPSKEVSRFIANWNKIPGGDLSGNSVVLVVPSGKNGFALVQGALDGCILGNYFASSLIKFGRAAATNGLKAFPDAEVFHPQDGART